MSLLVTPILLVPTRTTTATENVTIDFTAENVWSARFILDVTTIATVVGDTFDLYIQSGATLPTRVVVWDDFVHFTQVLGNATAPIRHIALWTLFGQAPESEMHAPQAAAIAVGVLQGPIGAQLRARAVIAGATPSFAWSLTLEATAL